jgi:hypothetical protein
MPQLPEQIRPVVAALAKYHFWILAALVPLVLVPMLLMGTGGLDKKIGEQRSQIESRVSALKGVQGIPEHPNESWSEAIDAQIEKIRDETVAEWQKFWQDQQFLRTWPQALGDDFIKSVAALKPGGVLKRDFLLRYQNAVKDLARELPKRMGADDLMVEGAVAGPGGVGPEGRPGPRFGGEFGGPRPGFGGEFGPRPGAEGVVPDGSGALLAWSAADQKRLYDSFNWEKPPSTTQVLLAQEELWVYGLFCDAIKKLNERAAGPFDAAIMAVEQLAVGYPAAEDKPGGEGMGRVVLAGPAAGPGGVDLGGEAAPAPPEPAPGEGGGGTGRPLNPRFAGASNPMMGGPSPGSPGAEGAVDPAAAAPAASPDEQLKEWIYVDFSGKPLTAAELSTVPAARMVHLMPFALRVTIDQRKLDALLTTLAASPVPIDVRQVRINPSQQSGAFSGGPGRGDMAPPMPSPGEAGGTGGRPFDVIVELRGTVGLAPPPDKNAIGGGEPAAAEGGA